MRTEDDLRAALTSLERHAPDPATVLAAVGTPKTTRPVTGHRRLSRPVLVAAAAASVAAVATATALLPGVFGPGAQNGPTASAGTAASALRQLAAAAASQPTPALGPVLYTKDALWVPGTGSLRNALLQWQWVNAAARYFVSEQAGAAARAAGFTKFDPRNNPDWTWRDPATLPTGEAALRRHLINYPGGRPASSADHPPTSPDELVFIRAVQLMTTEPLRPATRASMLRLIAGIAVRSPGVFIALGPITDRAGYHDVAIGAQSNESWKYDSRLHMWKLVHRRTTELNVLFFDPASGAIRAQERFTCRGRVDTVTTVSTRCTVANYEQYFVARAVRSLPKGASRASRLFAPYAFFSWPLIVR